MSRAQIIHMQLHQIAMQVAAIGGRSVDLGDRTESEIRNIEACGGKVTPIARAFDGTHLLVDLRVELTVNFVRFVATHRTRWTREQWERRHERNEEAA